VYPTSLSSLLFLYDALLYLCPLSLDCCPASLFGFSCLFLSFSPLLLSGQRELASLDPHVGLLCYAHTWSLAVEHERVAVSPFIVQFPFNISPKHCVKVGAICDIELLFKSPSTPVEVPTQYDRGLGSIGSSFGVLESLRMRHSYSNSTCLGGPFS